MTRPTATARAGACPADSSRRLLAQPSPADHRPTTTGAEDPFHAHSTHHHTPERRQRGAPHRQGGSFEVARRRGDDRVDTAAGALNTQLAKLQSKADAEGKAKEAKAGLHA